MTQIQVGSRFDFTPAAGGLSISRQRAAIARAWRFDHFRRGAPILRKKHELGWVLREPG